MDAIKALMSCYTSIFSEAVMVALFLDNFKMPNIALYDRKGDPVVHMKVFRI